MANEIASAGVLVKYAAEASVGAGKPSAGYTTIPNIKVTPEFSGEPETLEVTDLSDTEWKRYIAGLKDPGGAVGFTANLTAGFISAWGDLATAFATAKANGKRVYFEIYVPGVKSFYFWGEPCNLGVNEFDVNAVAEITAYVAVNGVVGWDTSST